MLAGLHRYGKNRIIDDGLWNAATVAGFEDTIYFIVTDGREQRGDNACRTWKNEMKNVPCLDLRKLGENTVYLDCDVLQADGGTRTASISGACVALVDAFSVLLERKRIKEDPLNGLIASVSVGMYNNEPVLDLDYPEDSNADTDMNVVMTQHGGFVEIQGTAEGVPFTREQSDTLLGLAEKGIQDIVRKQQEALGW